VEKYNNGQLQSLRRSGQLKCCVSHHEELKQLARNPVKAGVATSNEAWDMLLEEKVHETSEARGVGNIPKIGARYAARMRQKLKLSKKKKEVGYAARLEAEYDIKSCISTIFGFNAGLRYTAKANRIINYDVTRSIVSEGGGGDVTVTVDVSDDAVKLERPLKAEKESNNKDMDYYGSRDA
jgi:hypothetical protein